ncbi:MAG: fasciclin domain-containing protein [Bacteroidaceae bacterium]|nr:fasciclin domain-containing protein [Bacteroidaceae bacterium]
MKRLSFVAVLVTVLLSGCKEKIDTSARYVFTEYTVASYLETHECYSEYVKLLRKVPSSRVSSTTVFQLLSARGNYTCFAPTNEAIAEYLNKLTNEKMISAPSWDAFPSEHLRDSIEKVVVYNSIVDGQNDNNSRYYTNDITESSLFLGIPNMRSRRLECKLINGVATVDSCRIDENNRDIEAINGLIHQIHGVIAQKEINAASFFQEMVEKNVADTYLMMAKALMACGLRDTLSAVRDEVYETMRENGVITDFLRYMKNGYPSDMTAGSDDANAIAPEHREYGFTVFSETDDFWLAQGIDPTASDAVEKLQEWVANNPDMHTDKAYKVDDNYTSEDNMLNQWVTYHVLPMKLLPEQLVYYCNELYGMPVMEWYSTMGERRLLKLYSKNRVAGTVYLNRFPVRDEQGKETNEGETSSDPAKCGNLVLQDDPRVKKLKNICIYPLEKPLGYGSTLRDNLAKERIRFDGMALFPEAATNYIRRSRGGRDDKYNHVYIPANYIYQYFTNMSIDTEDTKFIYFNGFDYAWPLFSQDEMKAVGHYDIKFTLPPVPKAGIYELRYRMLATGVRGVVQVYFGSDPNNLPVTGIPIDMRRGLEYYVDPGVELNPKDADAKYDLDMALRNHMVMKIGRHESTDGKIGMGGKNVAFSNGNTAARDASNNVRHIIVRQQMFPDKTYYVRFKSVLENEQSEFHLDYFEYCPKEVFDNPMTPEDEF